MCSSGCPSGSQRLERQRAAADIYGDFFFQAEDGIRDVAVTGVQTCALPISIAAAAPRGRALLPTRPPFGASGPSDRGRDGGEALPSDDGSHRRVSGQPAAPRDRKSVV